MRIGVSLPTGGLDHGGEMPVAEAVERLGFDSVWAVHHVALSYQRESEYPYKRSATEIAMSPGMQGRDPAELDLSVARGLIPPGCEDESFIPS